MWQMMRVGIASGAFNVLLKWDLGKNVYSAHFVIQF